MGWLESQSETVVLHASPSETSRFGHPVDRMTVGSRWRETFSRATLADTMRSLLADSTARTVILRYPSDTAFVISDLGDTGCDVLPAGSMLYWEHGLGEDAAVVAGVTELVGTVLTPTQVSEVQAALADSFAGYVNHYSVNPLVRDAVVSEGYLDWARNTLSSEGSRVFLLGADEAIAGVGVVDAAGGKDFWEIQLAGIVAASQGRGLYRELVLGILASASGSGVSRVLISTQAHNTRVQRSWARLGFTPESAIDTVHLVRR